MNTIQTKRKHAAYWALGAAIGGAAALAFTLYKLQNNNEPLRYEAQPPNNTDANANFVTALGADCAICLCPMEREHEMLYLNCGHAFHNRCCKTMQEYTNICPLCREPIEDTESDD